MTAWKHPPIIDLKDFHAHGDESLKAEIGKKIVTVTEGWGCFYVLNSCVPDELMQLMHEQMVQYFDLPTYMKKQNTLQAPNKRHFGYTQVFRRFGDETVMVKESLAGDQFSPKVCPEGNDRINGIVDDYGKAVHAQGLQILNVLAASLGAEAAFPPCSQDTAAWRLHRYVRCAAPASVPRVVPHSDTTVLTIVNQMCGGGLQVRKAQRAQEIEERQVDGPVDGRVMDEDMWVDVKPVQGSFVVLVGDKLEAWSHGRFPSVQHRVVLDQTSERFSAVSLLDT